MIIKEKTVPPTVAKGRLADEVVKTRLIRKGFGVEKIMQAKTFDFKLTNKENNVYLAEVKYSKSWEYMERFKVFSIRADEMDRLVDYAAARNAKSAAMYFVNPVDRQIYYNSFHNLLDVEYTAKDANGEAYFPKITGTGKYLFSVEQFKILDKLTDAEIKKFEEIDNPPKTEISPSRDEDLPF